MNRLRFDQGTLIVDGEPLKMLPPQLERDTRVEKYRAPADARRALVGRFAKRKVDVQHASSVAKPFQVKLRTSYTLRPHQKEALAA
ncbi:MAG: hypothetical protein ACPL7K_02010 [Armatimonadota bacterium]